MLRWPIPPFTPAPIRQPRPSVAQRSGKRRQPPTTSAGDAFRQPAARPAQVPTSHPPPPGGGRRPGRAFDSHSSRDCQQAEEVVLFAAPPGYVPRCFAAPARDPRHRPPKNRYDEMVPAGGRLYRLPTPGTREEPAQRAAAAAAAAAGGSRSAARPDADHGDPPTTAPRAPTACLAHTHRLARLLPGAGRSTFSPPIVSWPYPPNGKGGAT